MKLTSCPVLVQVEITNLQGNITVGKSALEKSKLEFQDNQGRKHWSKMESNMGGFPSQNLAGLLLWLALGFHTKGWPRPR